MTKPSAVLTTSAACLIAACLGAGRALAVPLDAGASRDAEAQLASPASGDPSTSLAAALAEAFPPIWPTPKEFTNGTHTIFLCKSFDIAPPSPSGPDLSRIIARYRKLVMPRKVSPRAGDEAHAGCSVSELAGLVLVVEEPSAPLDSRSFFVSACLCLCLCLCQCL